MVREIQVTCVINFLCPWSYIALRAMELAMKKSAQDATFAFRLVSVPADVAALAQREGSELRRAYGLGPKLGIKFLDSGRPIVKTTESVDAALVVAQRWGRSLEFAHKLLRQYWEVGKDPNDVGVLTKVLVDELKIAVDAASEALAPSPDRSRLATELAGLCRQLGGAAALPKFRIIAEGCPEDFCAAAGTLSLEERTSQAFFQRAFEACLASSPSGGGGSSAMSCGRMVEETADTRRLPATGIPAREGLPEEVASAMGKLGDELQALVHRMADVAQTHDPEDRKQQPEHDQGGTVEGSSEQAAAGLALDSLD
eukprot:TRINITY_DN60569_c0_g1_i1.p1 TRINITY_DN60569_c0_g1~~TRINITY_DN60569_c0_g1_i1.p1  ORF type:complete len:313 (-),score=65.82 TRINITY_DN60569_c0_g1_i1:3-941(-)